MKQYRHENKFVSTFINNFALRIKEKKKKLNSGIIHDRMR